MASLWVPAQAAQWSVIDLGSTHELTRLFLNDRAQVAGTFENADGHLTGFFTGPGGSGRTPLVSLNGKESSVAGFTQSGRILAISSAPRADSGAEFAYALAEAGASSLTRLYDADDIIGQAAWINALGQVVGMGPSWGFGGAQAFYGRMPLPLDVMNIHVISDAEQMLIQTPKGLFISDLFGARGKKVVLPATMWGLDARALDPQGRVYGGIRRRGETLPRAMATDIKGTKWRELGGLADLGSMVLGVNVRGQAVGYADVNGETHAVVSGAGASGLRDLTGDVELPVGALTHAHAINASGQVVGYDSVNHKAYLLTPSGSSCIVNYQVTDVQDKTFSADVTILNTGGGAASGWTVGWSVNASVKLIDVQGATLKVKGKLIQGVPASAATTIDAQDGWTFSLTAKKGKTLPDALALTATLGGEPCQSEILPPL